MPTYSGQLAPAPRDPAQRFWDPDAQTMPRERIEEVQLRSLRALIDRAIETPVDHFARKLAQAGIESGADLTGLDDVHAIPTTVKQELRDSEAAHPPFGDYRFDPGGAVRLGQSTGTTGTPTIALLNHRDIWMEYESAARNWWRNGWRPGQVITHAHPGYLYGGGFLLSGSIEYFGMLNLWVEPPATDEAARAGIEMWKRVHPDVNFVAFSFNRFQEVAAEMGVDLKEDCGFPDFEFKGVGDKGLPFMTAGFECYAYAGGPCGVEPGGHLHEDWALIQAVDPATGREVPDGEWGNLVVTTLGRDNALLRYDLEEAIAIDRTPCSCGETTHRAFWGGRFKDFLDVQGKFFQVQEVEKALRKVKAVTRPSLEYVVVKPTDRESPLALRVEYAAQDTDDAATTAEQIESRITELVGIEAVVEIVARQSLERSGYKQTRLVDA